MPDQPASLDELSLFIFEACTKCAGKVKVSGGYLLCALEPPFSCAMIDLFRAVEVEKLSGVRVISADMDRAGVFSNIRKLPAIVSDENVIVKKRRYKEH